MIKREEITIHKSPRGHYFLDISNVEYDIYKAFNKLDDLIRELMKYPIENKDKLIKEIKENDKR